MSQTTPPHSATQFGELPADPSERHEVLLDVFGQWIFWHRNRALQASQEFVESGADRGKLGAIRRKYFDGVAALDREQRQAAMLLAQATLDAFLEQLIWSLGDEGTDAKFDDRHAYRFRLEIELVEVNSNEAVEQVPINRGGRFFGKNWGRWLNKFKSK